MNRAWHFDVAEPLFILVILGGAFSLAAWLLTIGTAPLDYRVANPARELAVLLAYLLPLAAYITWGGSAIRGFLPADPGNAVAILIAKLAFFVIIPAWMMRTLFGYTLRDLVPISFCGRDMVTLLAMSLLVIGFQAVFGRGL